MKSALIVDDHDDNRYLLRTILSASGYAVVEASSGVEALAQARRERPTIIISDILMPQMDGFSLCRVCKRDSALADIPFVFYTATYTSAQDEELALKLGAARFIIKPVSDDVFVAVIADVLGEHAGGRLGVRPPPADDETVYYRLYNEVLIHKLEEKVLELERQIAERLRADAERERLQAQLTQAQKMEAVGRLAGGVAHDFNNALCVIIGSAELALETTRPEAAAYEYLQAICDAGRRGAQIVRQLLAFARKETASAIGVNPNSALTSVHGMLSRLIGEDIELTMALQPGVWPIRIDPTHFDQIVINLLTNARDAMSGGGRIGVSTSNVTLGDEPDRPGHPRLPPGEYVSLTVTDTGSGMDAATRERMFEPFFTTKPDQFGTGLGLSTVLGIVERSGGRIDVRSEPGEGTTFTICLPRYTEVAPVEPAKPVAASKAGGGTVLVVDDNPELLTVVRRTLESYNYRVLTTTTATEAVRIAQGRDPEIDVLLTDLVMPFMSGKQVAQAARAHQPGLRVLYMSGYPAAVLSERALIGEGDPYIQKPFTPQTLAERIRHALSP